MLSIPILSPEQSTNITTNYNYCPFVELAKQQDIVLKEKRTLDKTISNLYLCHATDFFPKNGVINPKLGYQAAIPSPRLKNVIERLFSILRPTVHFSLNSIVSDHKDYKSNSTPRFCVIESFENAKDSLVGGYLEDLFCVGPYKLSPEAIVLVPKSAENDLSLKTDIENLKSKIKEIIYYEGEDNKAVTDLLQKKGASFFEPIESDPDRSNYFARIGKKSYIAGHSLMKTAEKTHCSHDVTPTAQIERLIATSEIYFEAPFSGLKNKYKFKDISQLIKGYVQSTKDVYKLKACQISYMDTYQKSVLSMLQVLYLAKTIDDLEKGYNAICPEDPILIETEEKKGLLERKESLQVSQGTSKEIISSHQNEPKIYPLKQRCKEKNKSALVFASLFIVVSAIFGSYYLSIKE